MLRWLGPRKAPTPNDGQADPIPSILQDEDVTDDPLAVLDTHRKGLKQIYSVSRVNPLFRDAPQKAPRQRSPQPGEKSSSSGYGSSLDQFYSDPKLRDESEQNQNFAKSVKPNRVGKNNRSPPSSGSSSGTLTTIPEGRVDLPIPKPIWPDRKPHDSLVDDALLRYTSLNQEQDFTTDRLDVSVKEVLVELLNGINATMDGSTGLTPEEMLKSVNEKIAASIELLRLTTEEEMKKLCVNLSNCRKINSVLRAFSNSPERTVSDADELYQIPSGSSSSGFSDLHALPVFIHEDLGSVPNGVRNAMIYGTLYRGKNLGSKPAKDAPPKRTSLRDVNDNKPSVWEQYYGVRAVQEGEVKYAAKPTDVPLFPGGRPEADFTLDVPRSELLSKRMKQDKKWRCRCRLLTSFLGLVFFLLSVMAVSLMLTRGKRMFGSMM
ncbi:uncharacterized protein LOC664468 isoform X2 [Tribolium castaneum]|uniref:uncharacterized protein LOC664468 isoform X2 n=1 Tax=Tribolium castaneum TaxID=7070 RepID=UPI00046BF55F|nr:PREDICTED: uncharacterized protein LOC664468 isoform X2 [Tribolium castaneum]|eukprot:XP_008195969.1 PREDICTED: uncharacterized protein LOC664468 isoform X2 [Tribolium castaneum]